MDPFLQWWKLRCGRLNTHVVHRNRGLWASLTTHGFVETVVRQTWTLVTAQLRLLCHSVPSLRCYSGAFFLDARTCVLTHRPGSKGQRSVSARRPGQSRGSVCVCLLADNKQMKAAAGPVPPRGRRGRSRGQVQQGAVSFSSRGTSSVL